MLLNEHRPDLAVFTEMWLDKEIPNEAFEMERHVALRCDKNSHGGGILCFTVSKLDFPFVNLVCGVVEILTVYIRELRLLLICCYHPVWNNTAKHELAISMIVDRKVSVLSSVQDFLYD